MGVYKDMGYSLLNDEAKNIVEIIRNEFESNKKFDVMKFLEKKRLT